MANYFFKLIKADGTILSLHAAVHHEMRGIWSEIAGLAQHRSMTGGRIIVTNQSGEMIVLVGSETARSFPAAPDKT